MRIVIDPGHDDLRVLDLARRQLGGQLSRLRVRTAPVPPAGDTAGAKSGAAQSLAELAVTGGLSAASVGAVARVLVAFVQRTEGRRLTVRHGTGEVSITGPVPAELMSAMEELLRQAAQDTAGATETGADVPDTGEAAEPAPDTSRGPEPRS